MSPLLFKILLAIIPLGLYFQVIKPLYSGGGTVLTVERPVTLLRQLSSEYDEAVLQAKDISSQAKELKSQYENIPGETKDRLSIMVPLTSSQAADPVRLLDEVHTIIEQVGFSAGPISYRELDGSPSTDKNKKGYTLSFSVKGTYIQFKELLATFQSSVRVYTIQSISFSAPGASEEGESSGLFSFQVVLETYFIP